MFSKPRAQKPKTPVRRPRNNKRRNANPSTAYKGEQTYKHNFTSVYLLAGTAPGGTVEPVNLGGVDEYAPMVAQFAKWRLNSFSLQIMPCSITTGAYAVRIFENTGVSLPVVPTDLGSVLVSGGKLKATTNAAENRITLRYRAKDLGAKIFNSTSSLSDGNFGDPGWIFFVQAGTTELPFEFYATVNAEFEFRDNVQDVARVHAIRKLQLIPVSQVPHEEEDEVDYANLLKELSLHKNSLLKGKVQPLSG